MNNTHFMFQIDHVTYKKLTSSMIYMNCFQKSNYGNDIQLKTPNILNLQINHFKYFTPFQIFKKSRKKVKKIKFTKEEDEKLYSLVEKYGENEWALISSHMENRNPRQCRERWKNCLNPKFSTNKWTKEEDNLLLEKFKEIGNHWNKITQYFPNRSMYSVRNRIIKINKNIIYNRNAYQENKIMKTLSNNSFDTYKKANSTPNSHKIIGPNTESTDLSLISIQKSASIDSITPPNSNDDENVQEMFDIFWDTDQDIGNFSIYI